MLATLTPRMASGQPPSTLPFGYSMDPQHELLFQDAPEPPPGDPLLTVNDEKALDHFFDEIKSNDFDFRSSYPEDGSLVFTPSWALPPQFMGLTTSYGQQPSLSVEPPLHGLVQPPFHHQSIIPEPPMVMPPPPPPPAAVALPPQPARLGQRTPQPQQPSAEMLAAANVLQNAPLSRGHGSSHETIFGRDVAPPLGPPVGHLRHQDIADFRKESQAHVPREHPDAFAEMMFATSAPPLAPLPLRTNAPVDVNWGSDMSFNAAQGFQPQSEKETGEALANSRMKYLECFDMSGNTRPPSPLPNGDPRSARSLTRARPSISQSDVADQDRDEPPRKRRKSRLKDESDDYEDDALAHDLTHARKRKSKLEGRQLSPVADGSRRRRKSGPAAAHGAPKTPRENLSEAQKRENHIKSEQKRRTLIKKGFDDLGDIVPGIKGGGFSKSTMLMMSTDWLAKLLAGNDELKKQLSSLRDQ